MRRCGRICASFSALQRAENSSISAGKVCFVGEFLFQCSSASRKFLNVTAAVRDGRLRGGFQCSSASRKFLNLKYDRSLQRAARVSVLFSEPKIPQSPDGYAR